jgi:hypothetical protein
VLAALDWSQRHLPHLEQQVRDLLGGCSSVRHQPAAVPMPDVAQADLREYAEWWASDRDPRTEPPGRIGPLTASDDTPVS